MVLTLVHLWGQTLVTYTWIHLQIQGLTRCLPIGPRDISLEGSVTSTRSSLVHDREILKNVMEKMERSQKNMKEQEKKKSSVWTKCWVHSTNFVAQVMRFIMMFFQIQIALPMGDDLFSDTLTISFWLCYYQDTFTFLLGQLNLDCFFCISSFPWWTCIIFIYLWCSLFKIFLFWFVHDVPYWAFKYIMLGWFILFCFLLLAAFLFFFDNKIWIDIAQWLIKWRVLREKSTIFCKCLIRCGCV